MAGRAANVEAMERTAAGGLRHPSFIGWLGKGKVMGVLRWGLAMPIVLLAAIGLINRHPGLLWLIPAGAVLFFLASLLWAYISTREPVRRASQEAARREAALADREALRRMAP